MISSFASEHKIKKVMEETLNRMEIRGRIGQEPKIFTVGDTRVARFSVATNEVFHDREGAIKEETTWHNVSAWEGRNIEAFDRIHKGSMVSVVGRLRNTRFTNTEGVEKYLTEVVANQLSLVQQGAAPGLRP